MRRTPIRSRFPALSNLVLREGQRQVRVRSGGYCEAGVHCCTIQAAQVHHIVLRSAGGADTADNLIAVCRPCHDWIHANPAEARFRGWYGRADRQTEGGAETPRANSTVTDAT